MFFFFNDTATTEIYTLSLHDALPILLDGGDHEVALMSQPTLICADTANASPPSAIPVSQSRQNRVRCRRNSPDRKSTRLNSSHANISYAVFCLKKKKNLHTK